MANRKQHEHEDYAETEVLPPHPSPDRVEALDDAAAQEHGRYEEYLRSLAEVPVLVDVVSEPPRAASKDFRRGQRPDARKTTRDDAAALRAQHASDVVQQYAEYTDTQKKRAKRVKRSARSKS